MGGKAVEKGIAKRLVCGGGISSDDVRTTLARTTEAIQSANQISPIPKEISLSNLHYLHNHESNLSFVKWETPAKCLHTL